MHSFHWRGVSVVSWDGLSRLFSSLTSSLVSQRVVVVKVEFYEIAWNTLLSGSRLELTYVSRSPFLECVWGIFITREDGRVLWKVWTWFSLLEWLHTSFTHTETVEGILFSSYWVLKLTLWFWLCLSALLSCLTFAFLCLFLPLPISFNLVQKNPETSQQGLVPGWSFLFLSLCLPLSPLLPPPLPPSLSLPGIQNWDYPF